MKYLFVFLFLGWIQSVSANSPRTLQIEIAPKKKITIAEHQLPGLVEYNHDIRGVCGGFFDLTDLRNPWKDRTEVALQKRTFSFEIRNSKTIEPLLPKMKSDRIREIVQKLSSYPTRYYKNENGIRSMQWLASEFKRLSLGRSDVRVDLFQHKFEQPSVVVTVQGTERPSEYVILGGHGDSINHNGFYANPNAEAPGADDNASGVAAFMHAFEVLMQDGFRPKRTLQFMVYAAEEIGLKGSADLANEYQRAGRNVVGVMQLDMTMFPGEGEKIVFMKDFVNPELTDFTSKLVTAYVKVPVDFDQCGYGCSDHASWTRSGYASVFPTESKFRSMNKKIHSVNDVLGILRPEHGLHFSKLALSFAVELSNP